MPKTPSLSQLMEPPDTPGGFTWLDKSHEIRFQALAVPANRMGTLCWHCLAVSTMRLTGRCDHSYVLGSARE
jgi:hypothetical protein